MSWEDWENGKYIGDEPYYGDDSDEEWGEDLENMKNEISYYLNIFKDVITTNTRIEIWYGYVLEEIKESTFEEVAREISGRYEIRTPIINQKSIRFNARRISFETWNNKTKNNREFSLTGWSWEKIHRFFGGDWHNWYVQNGKRPSHHKDSQTRATGYGQRSSKPTTSSKKCDAILADPEICHNLWDFRKIITEVRDWDYSVNDQSSYEKMTFQDVARSFTPPFQAKIKGEDELEGKRIIFNARTTPYQIQFYANDEGKKNNCVFTFNFTDWTLQEVRRFLGGCWFEEYVYYLVKSLKKKCKSIKDSQHNVALFNHEIDIVVSTKNRDFIIECKTGKIGKDVVENLCALVARYYKSIGKKSIGVLVSLQELDKTSVVAKEVRKSRNVCCISGDNIPKMIMESLLTFQPGFVQSQ